VTAVSAFIPQHTTFRHHAILKMASNDFKDFESSGDDSSEYKGEIDWDLEWKKVVKNKNQPKIRPGKDYYKSEAEIAAIKVANKAQEQLAEAASKIPSVPSYNSLKGDWKVRCCV
jgi:ribonuclease BN (tRNA processing enzyme)